MMKHHVHTVSALALTLFLAACQPPEARSPFFPPIAPFDPPSDLQPAPAPQPEPMPQPEPQPQPEPMPQPEPQPTWEPDPVPTWEPTPQPAPDIPEIINPPEALFCAGMGSNSNEQDTLLLSLQNPDNRQQILKLVLQLLPGSKFVGHQGGELYQLRLPAGLHSETAMHQLATSGASGFSTVPNTQMQSMVFTEPLAPIDLTALVSLQSTLNPNQPDLLGQPTQDPFWQELQKSWGHLKLGLPQAWQLTQIRPDLPIGVVEFGYDSHPDLSMRQIEHLSGQTTESIYQAHGNHVSGLFNAVANNGVGLSGGTQGKMMLRAYQVSYRELSCITDAIYRAGRDGVKVLSISLGLLRNRAMSDAELAQIYERLRPAFLPALRYARQQNMLIIASAGNGLRDGWRFLRHFDARYELPAGLAYEFDNVLAIGAMTERGEHAFFSNTGSDRQVFAYGPGQHIWSTVNAQQYDYMAGTSMAAPLVASVAAVIYSHFPDIQAHQVREALTHSASESIQGMPVVNAAAALHYAHQHFFPNLPLRQITAPEPEGYSVTLQIVNPLGEALSGVQVTPISETGVTVESQFSDAQGQVQLKTKEPIVNVNLIRPDEMLKPQQETLNLQEAGQQHTVVLRAEQVHVIPSFPASVLYTNPAFQTQISLQTVLAPSPGLLQGALSFKPYNHDVFPASGSGYVRLFSPSQGIVGQLPIQIAKGTPEALLKLPLLQFQYDSQGQPVDYLNVEIQLENQSMIYSGDLYLTK